MRHEDGPATLPIAKPLYGQVRDLVLNRIQQGQWTPGEALPNESSLANQFGVSIGTVRRAIESLEDCGLVKRVQGRGTYVTSEFSQSLRGRFTTIWPISGDKSELEYELLSIGEEAPSGTAARALQVSEKGPVLAIRQLLSVAGRPVGIECSILPLENLSRLRARMSSGQSIYPLLADQGVLIARAQEKVLVSGASGDTPGQLQLPAGAPVLRVERTAFSVDGRPIEYRLGFYACAHVMMECTVS
jgi:GntR family transcriptional regulator